MYGSNNEKESCIYEKDSIINIYDVPCASHGAGA